MRRNEDERGPWSVVIVDHGHGDDDGDGQYSPSYDGPILMPPVVAARVSSWPNV